MAKASKKANRFQNNGIPSSQVETKEKVIISPLFQQITGVVVDKEKEELFARDEVLRHEVQGALQKIEVALDEAHKTKIDYDEKNYPIVIVCIRCWLCNCAGECYKWFVG